MHVVMWRLGGVQQQTQADHRWAQAPSSPSPFRKAQKHQLQRWQAQVDGQATCFKAYIFEGFCDISFPLTPVLYSKAALIALIARIIHPLAEGVLLPLPTALRKPVRCTHAQRRSGPAWSPGRVDGCRGDRGRAGVEIFVLPS